MAWKVKLASWWPVSTKLHAALPSSDWFFAMPQRIEMPVGSPRNTPSAMSGDFAAGASAKAAPAAAIMNRTTNTVLRSSM